MCVSVAFTGTLPGQVKLWGGEALVLGCAWATKGSARLSTATSRAHSVNHQQNRVLQRVAKAPCRSPLASNAVASGASRCFLLRLCRILDDIGGAFGMGAVGGGLWHLLKGMKNSPSGARFRGGIDVRRGAVCGLGLAGGNGCRCTKWQPAHDARTPGECLTCPPALFPLPVHPTRGSQDWRQLCGVGRPLQRLRLHARRGAQEGGPLEQHRRGGSHRRRAPAAHGHAKRGAFGGVWRRAAGHDRRRGHPAHAHHRPPPRRQCPWWRCPARRRGAPSPPRRRQAPSPRP